MPNKDLEPIMGNKGHVSSTLSGSREITLKMARRLKDYFQLPAEIFLYSVREDSCGSNYGANEKAVMKEILITA